MNMDSDVLYIQIYALLFQTVPCVVFGRDELSTNLIYPLW